MKAADSAVRRSLHPPFKIRTDSAVRGYPCYPSKIQTESVVRGSLHPALKIRIDSAVRRSLHPLFDRGRNPSGWKGNGRFSINQYPTTRGQYSGIYMNNIICFTQSWISQLRPRRRFFFAYERAGQILSKPFVLRWFWPFKNFYRKFPRKYHQIHSIEYSHSRI